MADETTTTEEIKEKEPEYIKCPCCGEMTLRKPLDIKSIVLDEYMASIISGVPFSHTYTLYDNIDVTVVTPFKRDRLNVGMVIQALENIRARIPEADKLLADKLKAARVFIQTYCDITSIVTKKDGSVVKMYAPSEIINKFLAYIKDVGDNAELIVEEYENLDIPENVSTMPDAMLNAVLRTHRDLYGILMESGFTETFWKGIELV